MIILLPEEMRIGSCLSQQMPCAAIDQIFINFPEPPHHHQHQRIEDSQGKHLLRPSFFRELHRVLKDVGSITIPHLDSIATALAEERAVPLSGLSLFIHQSSSIEQLLSHHIIAPMSL
jgi:hypothetical protein